MAEASRPKDAPPPYTPDPKNPYPGGMPNPQNPYHAGYDQTNDAFARNAYPPVSPVQMTPQQMGMPTTNVQVTHVNTTPPIVVGQVRPADQTCLAIFFCLCCSPIPGIFAIFFAIKANQEFDAGNFEEGNRFNAYARYCMVASVVLAVVATIILVVVMAA